MAGALVLLALLSGCRHPAALSVRVVPAHKDVLHVHVELPEELEPLDYVSDSQRRTEVMQDANRTGAPPLYEVHYSYYSGADLLAFATYRRAPDGTLSHEKTLVHPQKSDRP